MDLATVFGIVIGLGLVIVTIFMSEGVGGFAPFLNYESFLIVIGGTICAILVNYPIRQVFRSLNVIKVVLTTSEENYTAEIIGTLVEFAKKAKQNGFLSLEGDLRKIKDNFMRRGVQMVVDGLDKEFINNTLENELGFVRERHKVMQDLFTALGTYAPAFGIIGTVLGMMLMLNSITDVEQVPRRMAMALASAFFGLGLGYLVFLPISGKLRQRSDEEILIKDIILRGIMLLVSGAAPSIIEENLKAYLEPSERALIKHN